MPEPAEMDFEALANEAEQLQAAAKNLGERLGRLGSLLSHVKLLEEENRCLTCELDDANAQAEQAEESYERLRDLIDELAEAKARVKGVAATDGDTMAVIDFDLAWMKVNREL